MDFALLPPEVNSARMYSGPGSGPMLAAASAWDGLAAQHHAAALGYESALGELSTEWSGPASAAMAAAAASFVEWLHATAAQAEQTAIGARTAAADYETAHAMTVAPAVVTANRSQLMTLLNTNFLGQNTAAIAANEAQYAQMWTQDAAAMYGYAASAAAASRLTPFSQPPQTTNASGSANQAAAGQAAATAAGSHTQTAVSAMTQALQSLAAPTAAAAPPGLGALAPAAAVEPGIAMSVAALASSLFGTFVIDSAGTFGVDVAGTFGIDLIGVGEIGSELLPYAELAGSAAPATAALAEAATIGGLSVPPTWTVAAPSVIQQVGAALPAAGATAAPAVTAVTASEAAIPFTEMAGAGLAGRATAGIGRGRNPSGKTTGKRAAPARPPQHSDQPLRPVNGPITRISGELRELADLHNAGILTTEEFTEEKRRLLGR
ncbi:MAG TPA: PPE domain-containing protein [Mycobacterium sp.]